jgi:hypothetical protein
VSAITFKPSTKAIIPEALQVQAAENVYTLMAGIVQDVPKEHLAPIQTQITSKGGTLAAAPTCSLVITGGAAGSYSFQVIPYNDNGDDIPPTATSTAVGPTTLDGTHFIDVNWTPIAYSSGYKVRRVTGGPSQGLIATLGASSLTFRDNGVAAQAYTPSGANPPNWGLLVGSPAEV